MRKGKVNDVPELWSMDEWIHDQSKFPIDAIFPILPTITDTMGCFADDKIGFQMGYATRVLTALLSFLGETWFEVHLHTRNGEPIYARRHVLAYLTFWSYVFEKLGDGGRRLPFQMEDAIHERIRTSIAGALRNWGSGYEELPSIADLKKRCNDDMKSEKDNLFRTKLEHHLHSPVVYGKIERKYVVSPFAFGFDKADKDIVSMDHQRGIRWAEMDEEFLMDCERTKISLPEEWTIELERVKGLRR